MNLSRRIDSLEQAIPNAENFEDWLERFSADEQQILIDFRERFDLPIPAHATPRQRGYGVKLLKEAIRDNDFEKFAIWAKSWRMEG